MLSITVNTLVDENDGIAVGGISLRDAVAAAAPNTEIEFASNLFGGNIQLTYGELDLPNDVNILGPGADQLTRISRRSMAGLLAMERPSARTRLSLRPTSIAG
jgi:hypothetical protein